MEELKAMVAQTSLPSADVTVEAVVTPSDMIGEKFKAAAAADQIVNIEDDEENVVETDPNPDDPNTHSHTNTDIDTNSIDPTTTAATATTATTAAATTAATTTTTTTTANTTTTTTDHATSKDEDDDTTSIPKEIELAAAQAAAAEMLKYALPSTPRLFVAPLSSSSSSSSSNSEADVAKKKVKLPRAVLLKLGASLKKGGAKHVFQIVAMLRESQRLKEDELRLRRQTTIKDYRTKVAMTWLNDSTQTQNNNNVLLALAEKLRQELERFDIIARRELEGMRRQHQNICEKAGIPEMRPTSSTESHAMERQRQVLSVIETASKIQKKT